MTNGYSHWCPGCLEMHAIYMSAPNVYKSNPVWSFDGNLNAPTFGPSIHIWCNQPGDEGYDASEPSERCHYFLEGGVIRFLDDCTHSLKGQKVPLPLLPPWLRDAQQD